LNTAAAIADLAVGVGVGILIVGFIMWFRGRYKMPTSRELLMDVTSQEHEEASSDRRGVEQIGIE